MRRSMGRRLLLNSMAYISRFSEDRPVAITLSFLPHQLLCPAQAAIHIQFSRALLEADIASHHACI